MPVSGELCTSCPSDVSRDVDVGAALWPRQRRVRCDAKRCLTNGPTFSFRRMIQRYMRMCDAIIRLLDAIIMINWLEVIRAFAPVATAVIALLALKNWQRQDKAKREAEFLDALIEAAHTYIAEMPKPIMLLEMARIGMESYVPTWENGEHTNKAVKGAITYIEKNGEREAKRCRIYWRPSNRE